MGWRKWDTWDANRAKRCEASWTNSSCVDGAMFCIREGKGRTGDCRNGGEGEEMAIWKVWKGRWKGRCKWKDDSRGGYTGDENSTADIQAISEGRERYLMKRQ